MDERVVVVDHEVHGTPRRLRPDSKKDCRGGAMLHQPPAVFQMRLIWAHRGLVLPLYIPEIRHSNLLEPALTHCNQALAHYALWRSPYWGRAVARDMQAKGTFPGKRSKHSHASFELRPKMAYKLSRRLPLPCRMRSVLWRTHTPKVAPKSWWAYRDTRKLFSV